MNTRIVASVALLAFLFVPSVGYTQVDLLKELRGKLTYPFALDFVLQHLRNEDLRSDDSVMIYGCSQPRSKVLEGFTCYESYSLYRAYSFNRRETYFLLTQHFWGAERWFLLANDSIHPILLDSTWQFQLMDSDFEFDSLNGGDVIRAEFRSHGSGFEGHHLLLLAIKDGKFVESFHGYLGACSAFDDTLRRSMSVIKYVDLDNDGFRDIQVERVEDILDPAQYDPYMDLEGQKRLKYVSTVIEKHLWKNELLRFVESK